MTTTYGFDFDLAGPPSRGARVARIDALATLLDTALVIPGTTVRFGLDALIGLFPAVGDIITTAFVPVHRARGISARRAEARHRAHARQRRARRRVRRGAAGRGRLRRFVAREPTQHAFAARVAGAR